MLHVVQPCCVGGEQVAAVHAHWLKHTVCGRKDGAREVGKVHLLVVPRAAIVALEVRVLLQSRVAVRRHHLAVRVHVDALALGLLQQVVQVVHVVARDQDGLARHRHQVHFSRLRRAKRIGVRVGQHLHHAPVALADLQRHSQQVADVGGLGAGQERQRAAEELEDLGVPRTQSLCVRRVRGHALEAIHDELLQAGRGGAKHLLPHADRRELRHCNELHDGLHALGRRVLLVKLERVRDLPKKRNLGGLWRRNACCRQLLRQLHV
mmetsp:Transcript_4621/g.13908  ORF Transcript_4621/g.13908 Transcript_4621/m.13908 type:complete len:265 (+) Transcript_4621:2764-3558(+)